MAGEKTLLQFAPFTSTIDNGFWHSFTKMKLETLKLSEEAVPILGYYSNGKQEANMASFIEGGVGRIQVLTKWVAHISTS